MMNNLKKYLYIFISALVLNVAWEHVHSLLYIHYKSAPITEYILFRAALFDAVLITLVVYLFLTVTDFKNKLLLVVLTLLFFAILLELWALETGRWAYTEFMPIIPFINTGLTPTIQLGLLGYLSILISHHVKR